MTPYRCPGCGQFERVVLVDSAVQVGNTVVVETTPWKYCQKCQDEFMAELPPRGVPSPWVRHATGTISSEVKS